MSNPLATFGGGISFFGLSLDQLSANLSVNDSSAQLLDHVQLRASQQKDATFKMGLRYPIQTSSYSSMASSVSTSTLQSLGLSSSQISALTSSSSSTIPSVSYEDIGLVLKAKTLIHGTSDVSLDLEIQFRTLGATTVNGNPIILNREYKGATLLKEGRSRGSGRNDHQVRREEPERPACVLRRCRPWRPHITAFYTGRG